MTSVTKTFSWDMAHMLAGHQGLCKNLHGHTYKMEVKVARRSKELIKGACGSLGMVIDFKDLKRIVKEEIIEPLDHAFMYWSNSSDPVEHEIAEILKESGRKVATVDFRPTAEGMANYFLELLDERFNKLDIIVISIKVWETPTSYAEVRGEE